MNFAAGVYYENNLRMNNYNLRLWMTTNSANTIDQSVAFERIKYFIYTQMDSTIFINKELEDQCHQFVKAGLNITTMPGDPVDQLVGIMLYYKLNAIAEGRMIIMETELASIQGENMTYLHSDFENPLGYEQPAWWTAPDLTHSDIVPVESEKIVSMPTGTSWRELDMAWAEVPTDDTTGNIVVFADFKRADETE
jgi:hypothetical protein